MPIYRAINKCYINNSIRKAGEEFEYNGPNNTNLKPLDGGKYKDKSAEPEKSTPKAKLAAEAGMDESRLI